MQPSMTQNNTRSSSRKPAPAPDYEPPNLALLAMEFRMPWEFASMLPAWPMLQRAPRGDGHNVVVYPGLSASDATTLPLRKYLDSLGYQTHGWGQGFNFGPRAGVLETGKAQLRSLARSSTQSISLIGWSLGGIYARELSKELDNEGIATRSVITLGTPFAGGPRSTNAWRLYELTSGRDIHRETDSYDMATAPAAPTTSIYSRTDGVVAWQASVQAAQKHNLHTENIEVVASHFGIGLNPSAMWAIADRLAQVPGRWQAFQKPSLLGLQSLVYPDPKR
jgi:triacylglycerol esterase/lipase EstA (alpha/beta hydrolase family)